MKEILIGDFLIVLLIFLRILAMMIAAPVLGSNVIPAMARIFIAFVIAYIVFLTIDKSKIVLDVNLISIFLSAIKEIITGTIIGMVLNFIFFGISYAGHMIGFDMGLMMAEVMNPSSEVQNNVIGEVLFFGSLLLFIVINGHHFLISATVASFNIVPVAKYSITEPLIGLIIKYSSAVFIIAMKIAAPIVVSFLLIHIAEGIIARVIPQIQIMFITQPLKIGLGFIFLSILIPLYIYVIKNLLQGYQDQLSQMLNAMST
ncbi:MAG: flagellar biosynthetic protein FliR [Ignavibacteria bacterium]|nr:MAG: flagellar biosynthetic protein FliR [Ignavibacteria bacterium]KAF0160133.1 MAG: flagellar biosynthetic protein FliR [Ignavibacteria bacterium]